MNYSFFYEIAVLLLVASSTCVPPPRGRAALRVLHGYNDTDGRYPYVVALVSEKQRLCTGSLIASNWVLTAAHCHVPEVVAIQYGDMTVPPEQSITKRNIIKFIKPNMSIQWRLNDKTLYTRNDIALVKVEEVRMDVYGRISSVNYKTLMGLSVEYAGYGSTSRAPTPSPVKELVKMPLQLGAGVVRPCAKEFITPNSGPILCVSSRCGSDQAAFFGDSGGPLVYDGKIVGVASFIYIALQGFTPVSLYLEWVQNTMATYIDEN